MTRDEMEALLAIKEEMERRKRYNKLQSFFPDEGPLRRELYKKHLQFFKAGAIHQERAAIAGNRCGKTIMGVYEATLHLTGLYPHWWEGRRFDHPVDWWAASDTTETTRDILQLEFLGPLLEIGTGMIPKHALVGDPSRRRGVPDAIDTVRVKHVSGGTSVLGFKAYDQGREKFQGTAKHGINLDEEPASDIYFECLTRLMTTSGLMIATFTPLSGMSDIVLRYMPDLAMESDEGKTA
jgi:phage terminase large subunit-like protein